MEAEEYGGSVSKQENEKLVREANIANKEILKTIDIGGFLISEEAVERLKQYQGKSEEASRAPAWFEHIEMDYIATKSCLDDLIILAKNDLDKKHGEFSLQAYCRQKLCEIKKITSDVFRRLGKQWKILQKKLSNQ
ncbi:MAG: hypothetical protein KAJ29_05820 [Alphaproteobacteria bacterium]|nr:hypothetical protein [Alphaproteobacteria bacterium]